MVGSRWDEIISISVLASLPFCWASFVQCIELVVAHTYFMQSLSLWIFKTAVETDYHYSSFKLKYVWLYAQIFVFYLQTVNFYLLQIRLHVIAMHELCEYSKGEGFSEGFDAHLNIEQMNKTSVELFQMYDDHRKKGITIPTEKEFRGYYALLKLDKHPGYIVSLLQ